MFGQFRGLLGLVRGRCVARNRDEVTFEENLLQAVPVGLPVLVINGDKFDDFEGFVTRFSALLQDLEWNGSLDATIRLRRAVASPA